ncbi:MAG: ribose 5-phosphate isomerase B, partial [SAR202 cluster bacterium]|nr:ribose 5-phosphate isomerase B [SAR202 cluster bacterium]
MRIAIGADHRGYAMKEALVKAMRESGHEVQDFGCHSTASVDYPDVARDVGETVGEGRAERGVLICSNGIGMSISANKVEGVRAALCYDADNARRAREHNDANVLCLGGDSIPETRARDLVQVFLSTRWDGETPQGARHAGRVAKIKSLDR